MKRFFLLLSLLLLVPVGATWATDFYVDQDSLGGACHDGNAGTLSSPLCTVQAGVNRLGPGHTLYIRAATYLVNINLAGLFGTETQPVRITGYQDERPVLMACLCGAAGGDGTDHNATVFFRGTAAYIDFANLIFDGNQRRGTVGFATSYGNPPQYEHFPHHVRYFNCEFRQSEAEYSLSWVHHWAWYGGSFHGFGDPNGLRHAIYAASRSHEIVIDGVEFYEVDEGYCVHFAGDNINYPASSGIVRNSIFHGCGKNQHQSAIVMSGVGSAEIANNVIWGSGGGGIYVAHGGYGSDNVHVYHNTITANMVGTGAQQGFYAVYIRGGTGHIVRNNIIYNNAGRDFGQDCGACLVADHNFFDNPLFRGEATHNYHLTATSPVRGAGLFLGAPYDRDIEGTPFPNPPDIGAYAYAAAAPAPVPVKGTFYVAPDGSDAPDCPAAVGNVGVPFATLRKALACAAGESTITLRQGTYTESIQTSLTPIAPGSSWEAPTTLASYPGETATLRPTRAGAIVGLDNPTTDHYLVFDRLVLDGSHAPGSYGLQVNAGAHHIRFQQGDIRRVANNAVYLAGTTTEVLGSQLHDNTSAGALVALAGASNVLRGNTIFGGISAGIFLFGGAQHTLLDANIIRTNAFRGLRAQAGTANTAVNNLIYSNGGDGIVVEAGETGLTLAHNTVWSNAAVGLTILAGARSTASTNNLFFQNGTDTPSNAGTGTIATTNVSGNPAFVAPGPPTTFHVEGANVVHVGTTLPAVTTDFDGKRRSTPPGYTIGAYQDDGRGGPPPARGRPYTTSSFSALP